jgi:hypothetical protein
MTVSLVSSSSSLKLLGNNSSVPECHGLKGIKREIQRERKKERESERGYYS